VEGMAGIEGKGGRYSSLEEKNTISAKI